MEDLRQKIVLLDTINHTGDKIFFDGGYSVVRVPARAFERPISVDLEGAVALGIRSGNKITAEIIESIPNLLAIGAFCIGTNQIDLAACSKRGIAVFNAPYSNVRSVAELALAFILCLSRGICHNSKLMHEGNWQKSSSGAFEIRGKKLGIIGYGNIGTQLSVLAEGLGMQVCFFDIAEKPTLGNVHKCAELDELLAESDFVSVHIDVDPRRKDPTVIGEKEIARMKYGSFLLNTSRGRVVDEVALASALESGKIAGVAFDVFQNEPTAANPKFVSPLQNHPKTILTPHIGGSTEEAQENAGEFTSTAIRAFIESGSTANAVNLPRVMLQRHLRGTRIMYFHKNVPGAYAKFTTMIGDAGLNINAASNLDTKGEFGYVIVDVDKTVTPPLRSRLEDLPEAIRVRIVER